MPTSPARAQRAFTLRLRRNYFWYTCAFVAFVVSLAVLEKLGMPRAVIGYVFLFGTIAAYTCIGLLSRTADLNEYYVAGRRVPAVFNGMATGADWMSAASFISMAGVLYLSGFDGLAYVLGWTGGYCLVALLLAPYLRRFGQFTVPDFLGARYDSKPVRVIGALAAILCSFVYLVAQIYGVGLITSRFTGVEFGVGVFLGLAGILVCSFLGGMRAITWTQVAQYIVLLLAYLVPVMWLSAKHADFPVPQLVYGEVLQKVTQREAELTADPKEREVRAIFAAQAEALERRMERLPHSWETGREAMQRQLRDLRIANAQFDEIRMAERELAAYPKNPEEAEAAWGAARATALARSAAPVPHAQPFPGGDEAVREAKRKNFLALMFCLMIGTAALPHILVRYYTTPSVAETRRSVFWSILCIALLYFMAPALAVLVKFDVMNGLVGTAFTDLPDWVGHWANLDKLNPLMTIADVNRDGIVQFAEIVINSDVFMLAMPEIAGLPYVVSGLVAAGGLAAALSTADGLLLTIAGALSHDLYYKTLAPKASPSRRVTLAKILLLIVALLAAYVTALRPGDILLMVGAAFSLAASAFFPALLAGIFWRRANHFGAIAGMLTGMGVCLFYMGHTYPFLTRLFGIEPMEKWWGIEPISAGVFGVPAGLAAVIAVSLLTPRPATACLETIAQVRSPAPR